MSIKKGTMPPRYDEAFKSGAIKMVTEQGRPSKEVAAELGICIDTLKSWLKRAGFQPGATDRQNQSDKRQCFFIIFHLLNLYLPFRQHKHTTEDGISLRSFFKVLFFD